VAFAGSVDAGCDVADVGSPQCVLDGVGGRVSSQDGVQFDVDAEFVEVGRLAGGGASEDLVRR
jgi:hypothetical protein